MQSKTANFSLIGQAIAHDKKMNTIESYLETISSCMPGNFYWKDRDGRYLGANKALLQTAGLEDISSLIGKTDYDLWPEEAGQLQENDRQVMKSGAPVNFEETVSFRTKSTSYFTVSKVPLRDENGKIVGIIGNSLEITELKKTQVALQEAKEQAEAASEAKSAFIANMSHDIRTPLIGLLGMAKEIVYQSQETEIKTYAQYMASASERLLELLNEILDAAKYDLENSVDNQRIFNAQELLNSIKDLFFPSFHQKKLRFKLDYDSQIPDRLEGNVTSMHRVLLNLLSNAIKFTDSGEVSLSALWEKKSASNSFITFIVTDTGIGIPQAKLGTIFEPFTRLTPAYEGTYQGVGLGLYIVKQFIESVGGTIEVTSTLDEGSTFKVNFPVKDMQNQISNYSASDTENVLFSNDRKLNILVVEDNFLAGKIVLMLLERLGYNANLAISGKAALKEIQEKEYDLIYMDLGLPDHDGREVTRSIRDWEKMTNKKPSFIIALTAHEDDTGKQLCQDAGMNDFIQKPLTENLVQQHIKIWKHKNLVTPQGAKK